MVLSDNVMLLDMDSGTHQAFVMASVARFCSLWDAGMDAVLKLESVRGQATLYLEARLGSVWFRSWLLIRGCSAF